MSEFDPAHFLLTVFPAWLSAKPSAGRGAVVQLIVADREDCDVAYEISSSGVSVSRGVSDRSQLTLSFILKDLAAFASGTLDVARAVRTKRLKVLGDESLLELMSARLAGEAGSAR